MDSAKYRNILEHVKGQSYPDRFSKNGKLIMVSKDCPTIGEHVVVLFMT